MYFSGIIGEFVKPINTFVYMVVQDGDVVKARKALGMEVIWSNSHSVNSVTLWSLGISSSAARCKNKAISELAVRVGVSSHSAVNNDKLNDIQRLEEDLHRFYELIGEPKRGSFYSFSVVYP